MTTEAFLTNYLLYFVMPLWLLSGVADWLCHRASHIETTSGPKESVIHLVMMAEAGLAVLAGLLLEINGLVLLIMALLWIAHEVTSYWDVSYAHGRRHVSPIEQRVHDYLGVVPLLALSMVVVLHWPQALALVGAGPEPLRMTLTLKQQPLPAAYVVTLLVLIALLEILPFCEELLRGLRERRRHAPAE